MTTIKLNQVIFLTHTGQLSTAQRELSSIAINLPNVTSQSKVLDHYNQQFQALSQMIKQYSHLLNQDIDKMKTTGTSLSTQDDALSNLYLK